MDAMEITPAATVIPPSKSTSILFLFGRHVNSILPSLVMVGKTSNRYDPEWISGVPRGPDIMGFKFDRYNFFSSTTSAPPTRLSNWSWNHDCHGTLHSCLHGILYDSSLCLPIVCDTTPEPDCRFCPSLSRATHDTTYFLYYQSCVCLQSIAIFGSLCGNYGILLCDRWYIIGTQYLWIRTIRAVVVRITEPSDMVLSLSIVGNDVQLLIGSYITTTFNGMGHLCTTVFIFCYFLVWALFLSNTKSGTAIE
mmetsp:Transcript_27166/g.41112  ORF Transcript_27166/g.41112 Transcript_27166/m.41112 type:complete len:251 (-) Transcript_27166:338-1090(-)